ncbi:intracellular serine protease [Fusarium flagelliforme]|uniref:Intracellular serine protease n=1 Tax=Fusarium flagelliforme TaxID=2675880 RepID=A0A395M618_9HYPO|nr:intracellular serine protease [Fusarium flagelliforme]
MSDDDDPRGFFQSVLGIFTRIRPQKSAKPRSLKTRWQEAWLRADAFAQQDDLDRADPESVERTLRACERYVQDDYDQEIDFSRQPGLERYLGLRHMLNDPTTDPYAEPRTSIRRRKRGRRGDDLLDEFGNLEQESKRRRVLCRQEPSHEPNSQEPDADFAMLMRRHLVTLDNALRMHWVCVCQKCSGLTVRLSLPQHKKDLEAEASFEVFFGVRSVPATVLQEGKITVKDLRNSTSRCPSEPILSHPPEFAHICQSITESLGQRNCLHFALEEGIFQRLRPQPKTFGSDRVSRTISLSALFNRQKELLRGESVLPLKGKRILALTLASALLPFLETPWLQFSFDHSKIHFFEPMKDGELPDITKPFLSLEHVPTASTRTTHSSEDADSLKHIVHPNASVLALGILLCELHYCIPVELMSKGSNAEKGVNDDMYTCLNKLEDLEDDAGVDYYHATKACLTGEYYPTGERANFEDVSVQRLFYQNVVKRLEAVVFKAWGICLDNLDFEIDHVQPVRIAILDSGLDTESPFLVEDQQLPNPRIKEVRSFIHGTEPHDVQDEIGHGTHALGLLLKVAPCAEIYVARIARREALGPNTYDDIAKAINYSVEQWGADIISMSFGIREQHEGMNRAISDALNKRTLLFAAASNDGANLSRAFPAKCRGVFCIHSTDGNGNPSSFNPTASETDVNFSLLGESVSSHWPAGLNGHDQSVNVMSGTSVATPIAAGLAASVLSFARQQDQNVPIESDRLGPWLKIDSSMNAVLKSMVRQRRGAGYDYITPHVLFDSGATRDFVYGKMNDLRRNLYRYE